MIASTYSIIDLGSDIKTITLPIYTNNSSIILTYKPDWLYVSGYEQDDEINAPDGKIELQVKHGDGFFKQAYDDNIVFSDTDFSEEFSISVIWSFKSDSLSLDDIADQFEFMSEGTPIENVHRKNIILALKNNLQKLSFDGYGDIQRFDTQTDNVGRIFAPIDMIEPLSLYAIDDNGNKNLLYRDDKLNVGSSSALLDEDGSVILDSNSYWIEGSGLGSIPSPNSTSYYTVPSVVDDLTRDYSFSNSGRFTNISGLKGGVKSFFGQYSYIKKDGYFFVQDCPYDYFTLEYVSDPILNAQMKKSITEIYIPKYWVDSLKAYTFYDLVKWRSDVPMGEKEMARLEADRQFSIAKRRSVDYMAVIQAAKSRRNINKR